MKTYDELSEENDRLHSELQLDKLAKLEIRQLHQDARHGAESLRRELDAAREEAAAKDAEIERLSKLVEARGRAMTKKVDEVTRLRRELAEAKDDAEEEVASNVGLRMKLAEVRGDLSGLIGATEDLRRELAEERGRREALGKVLHLVRNAPEVYRHDGLENIAREIEAAIQDTTPPAGEGSPPVGAYVCDDFSPSRFSDTACGRCGMPKGDHAAPPAGGAEEWDAMRLDLLRSLPQRYFELASSIVDRHDPRKGGE